MDELERIVRDIDRSEMLFAALPRLDRARVGRRLVTLHIELVAVLAELGTTDEATAVEQRARRLVRGFRDRPYRSFDTAGTGFGSAWG